ncbi:hypothetical protein JOF53_002616 [Crossiella equi]|uniref:Uncharacterized protein n=1 Tax=Crossiella equi TaxID=130796 RepID=A0ABS5AAZ6_9PSEU|nr:hypothetical protein [Crossiella equi]MBP2473744.1 hypothetical protein [Crossiella equi]
MFARLLAASPSTPEPQPLLTDQAQLTIVLVVWLVVAVVLTVVVLRSWWRKRRADVLAKREAGPFLRLMPPEADSKVS